jgi:hypothetical protein
LAIFLACTDDNEFETSPRTVMTNAVGNMAAVFDEAGVSIGSMGNLLGSEGPTEA